MKNYLILGFAIVLFLCFLAYPEPTFASESGSEDYPSTYNVDITFYGNYRCSADGVYNSGTSSQAVRIVGTVQSSGGRYVWLPININGLMWYRIFDTVSRSLVYTSADNELIKPNQYVNFNLMYSVDGGALNPIADSFTIYGVGTNPIPETIDLMSNPRTVCKSTYPTMLATNSGFANSCMLVMGETFSNVFKAFDYLVEQIGVQDDTFKPVLTEVYDAVSYTDDGLPTNFIKLKFDKNFEDLTPVNLIISNVQVRLANENRVHIIDTHKVTGWTGGLGDVGSCSFNKDNILVGLGLNSASIGYVAFTTQYGFLINGERVFSEPQAYIIKYGEDYNYISEAYIDGDGYSFGGKTIILDADISGIWSTSKISYEPPTIYETDFDFGDVDLTDIGSIFKNLFSGVSGFVGVIGTVIHTLFGDLVSVLLSAAVSVGLLLRVLGR